MCEISVTLGSNHVFNKTLLKRKGGRERETEWEECKLLRIERKRMSVKKTKRRVLGYKHEVNKSKRWNVINRKCLDKILTYSRSTYIKLLIGSCNEILKV